MSNPITSRVRTAAIPIAAAVLFIVTSLATAAPIYAQGPATPPRTDARAKVRERQFKREQTWFDDQTKRLANPIAIATATQKFIDAQNALGKDTSSLVAALATYNSQIASAQSSHNTAGSLISAHTGFDGNGKVVNLTQASQTVIDTRKALGDAHRIIRQASEDLRKAIRAYRQANAKS